MPMKATLDVVLFLLTSIAVSVGTVAAGAAVVCAVAGGGCWWWLSRRGRQK